MTLMQIIGEIRKIFGYPMLKTMFYVPHIVTLDIINVWKKKQASQ